MYFREGKYAHHLRNFTFKQEAIYSNFFFFFYHGIQTNHPSLPTTERVPRTWIFQVLVLGKLE